MHSFEVHSNKSACITKVRLGLEQVINTKHGINQFPSDSWRGIQEGKIKLKNWRYYSASDQKIQRALIQAVASTKDDIQDSQSVKDQPSCAYPNIAK